jgi:LysR family transcriptional regulator, nitrogen assimilation regulatory protein
MMWINDTLPNLEIFMDGMEIRRLRYFLEISKAGNLKRAAETLTVAQSALSNHMRLLEIDLSVQLFHRNGRGVVLTEAGRRLLQHARIILDNVEAAKAELAAFTATPQGRISLGVTPTITQILAVPLIQQLRAEHPLITLQITEGFSGHVLEWLSNGRVEVGIVYDAPRTKQFDTRELLIEDLFLVGPAGDERKRDIDLKDIGDLPLILPSPPHGLRILIESIAAQNNLTLRVDLELDALQPIKTLVEKGMGWTILPLPTVHPDVVAERLWARRIINPCVRRRVMLATLNNRPVSPTMEILIRLIQSGAQDLLVNGAWPLQ